MPANPCHFLQLYPHLKGFTLVRVVFLNRLYFDKHGDTLLIFLPVLYC